MPHPSTPLALDDAAAGIPHTAADVGDRAVFEGAAVGVGARLDLDGRVRRARQPLAQDIRADAVACVGARQPLRLALPRVAPRGK